MFSEKCLGSIQITSCNPKTLLGSPSSFGNPQAVLGYIIYSRLWNVYNTGKDITLTFHQRARWVQDTQKFVSEDEEMKSHHTAYARNFTTTNQHRRASAEQRDPTRIPLLPQVVRNVLATNSEPLMKTTFGCCMQQRVQLSWTTEPALS